MSNLQNNPFGVIRQIAKGKYVDNTIDSNGVHSIEGDAKKSINKIESYQKVGDSLVGYVGDTFQLGDTGTSDTKEIYSFDNTLPDAYNGYIENVTLSYDGTTTGYATLEIVYSNSVGTIQTQQFKLNLENSGETVAELNLQFSPEYNVSFRVWGKSGGNGYITAVAKLKIFEQ